MFNIILTSSLHNVGGHIAQHIDKSAKKFLFILTASENAEGEKKWKIDDKKSLTDQGYDLEDYTITGKTAEEVENKLAGVDGIVMEGGNPFYLLQQIQLTKTAEVFKKFVSSGKYYIGSSAGAMVAGPDIYASRGLDDVSEAPQINGYEGLNLTDIAVQPHWGSDKFRDLYLNETVANLYTSGLKTVLLTDTQYLLVDVDKNIKIVDSACE
ncbi:MAG: Type 1 glutamine amidotransferase-like domain-containing protein [Candidatus Berkelbacteria bacterium]